MPTDWVAPEVFFEHGGYTVYYVYKDDNLGSGVRDNWFSLSETGADDDDHGVNGVFDVRQLPQVGDEAPDLESVEGLQAFITATIDSGHFDDWVDEAGDTMSREPDLADKLPELPVLGYTWAKLADDIAKMSPEDRQKPVRGREPYQDDAETLSFDSMDSDDEGPYLV